MFKCLQINMGLFQQQLLFRQQQQQAAFQRQQLGGPPQSEPLNLHRGTFAEAYQQEQSNRSQQQTQTSAQYAVSLSHQAANNTVYFRELLRMESDALKWLLQEGLDKALEPKICRFLDFIAGVKRIEVLTAHDVEKVKELFTSIIVQLHSVTTPTDRNGNNGEPWYNANDFSSAYASAHFESSNADYQNVSVFLLSQSRLINYVLAFYLFDSFCY